MADDDDARARTAERIAQVRSRFVAGLGGRLAALGKLAGEATGDDVAQASAAAGNLRLGLHNLSGGAPTLGLAEVGRRASELERRLMAERLPDGRLSPQSAAELAADLARLAEDAG